MAVPRFNPFLDFLLHPHVGQIVSRPSSFQPFFFFFVFKTFDVGAIASPQQIGNSEDNIQFSSTNHIVVVVLHVTPVTTKCHRRRQKNRVQLWQFRLFCNSLSSSHAAWKLFDSQVCNRHQESKTDFSVGLTSPYLLFCHKCHKFSREFLLSSRFVCLFFGVKTDH